MAKFECNGIDGFVLDMEEFARLPDTVVDEMLLAGAEVVRKAHVAAIKKNFDEHTEKLIGSPTIRLKTGTGDHHLSRQWSNSRSSYQYHDAGEHYALIYPTGEHHRYRKKTHDYTDYNWGRAGKTKTTSADGKATNSDVAFVQEFGGHGVMKALGWMKKANEECADAMATAEERAYDKWLKSLNL